MLINNVVCYAAQWNDILSTERSSAAKQMAIILSHSVQYIYITQRNKIKSTSFLIGNDLARTLTLQLKTIN